MQHTLIRVERQVGEQHRTPPSVASGEALRERSGDGRDAGTTGSGHGDQIARPEPRRRGRHDRAGHAARDRLRQRRQGREQVGHGEGGRQDVGGPECVPVSADPRVVDHEHLDPGPTRRVDEVAIDARKASIDEQGGEGSARRQPDARLLVADALHQLERERALFAMRARSVNQDDRA